MLSSPMRPASMLSNFCHISSTIHTLRVWRLALKLQDIFYETSHILHISVLLYCSVRSGCFSTHQGNAPGFKGSCAALFYFWQCTDLQSYKQQSSCRPDIYRLCAFLYSYLLPARWEHSQNIATFWQSRSHSLSLLSLQAAKISTDKKYRR